MRIQDRCQGYVLYQLWGEAIAKKMCDKMKKTMILHVCLGILLLGIVITPNVFAGDGCGTGTVLVDGVCQLAPIESSEGCGAGTVMVNGVCQLDNSSGSRIPPIYIVGAAAAIGAAIIGIVSAVRRGSKTSKPQQSEPSQPQTQSVSSTIGNVVKILEDPSYQTTERKARQQEMEEYEEKYLARQGQRPTRKPAESRPTSSSCNSCGRPLKPTAKFCGGCGTPCS